MSARKDVMVEPKNGRWYVRTTGQRAHVSFDTQADAIVYSKLLAKKYESEVRVKSSENKVRLTTSFKKEPKKETKAAAKPAAKAAAKAKE